MADGHDGERFANLEVQVRELSRQIEAQWKKVDENNEKISEMKLLHVQEWAKLESLVSTTDKRQMSDLFQLRSEVKEIGFRVGIVVTAAVLILNYVVSKIDIGDLLTASRPGVTAKRTR